MAKKSVRDRITSSDLFLSGESWSANEMAQHIRASSPAVRANITNMHAQDIIERAEQGRTTRYRKPSVNMLLRTNWRRHTNEQLGIEHG